MSVIACAEGETREQCPPTDDCQTVLKAETVRGLTVILRHEDAENCDLEDAVEAALWTFMCTGFQSLQVHPAYRRLVLNLANEQFKGQYGSGYRRREDWRLLFGEDDGNDADQGVRGAAVELPPIPQFLLRRS